MTTDTIRTSCAFALVASVITAILLGASDCHDPAAYIAVAILAIMAAFIGSTQDD